MFVRKRGVVYHGSKSMFSALEGNVDDFRDPQLFRTSLDGFSKMTIKRRVDGEMTELVIARLGRELWLEKPIRARADSGAAGSLVSGVLGLAVRSFAMGNAGPEERLDYVIEVDGVLGREVVTLTRRTDSLFVGKQEPRDLAFAMESPELLRGLKVQVEQLRSRLLNPFPSKELRRIVLDPGAGRGAAAVLRRGASDLFELEAPIQSTTHASATLQLLEGLGGLFAAEFVDEPGPDSETGLGDDAFRVELTGRLDPKPVVILLGRDVSGLTYARRAEEKHVIKVPTEAVAKLRAGWTEYVSRDIFKISQVARIQRLQYRRGEQTVLYVRSREDGVWRVGSATGGPVPGAIDLDEVRDELGDLRGASVIDPAQAGALEGGIEIQAQEYSGHVFTTFTVFPREGGSLIRVPTKKVLYSLRGGLTRTILGPAPQ